jgi:hypothetical protein
MARVLRTLFLVLGVCATLAWGVFYVWIMGLACGFSSPNGNCRTRMPWELHGEDLVLLVLVPGALTLGLFAMAWVCHRAATNPRDPKDAP